MGTTPVFLRGPWQQKSNPNKLLDIDFSLILSYYPFKDDQASHDLQWLMLICGNLYSPHFALIIIHFVGGKCSQW